MNKEQFLNNIQGALHGKAIKSEGLDEIVARYPFCQSAQMLYFLSLLQHNDIQYHSRLKLMSAYAGDRGLLKEWVDQITWISQQEQGTDSSDAPSGHEKGKSMLPSEIEPAESISLEDEVLDEEPVYIEPEKIEDPNPPEVLINEPVKSEATEESEKVILPEMESFDVPVIENDELSQIEKTDSVEGEVQESVETVEIEPIEVFKPEPIENPVELNGPEKSSEPAGLINQLPQEEQGKDVDISGSIDTEQDEVLLADSDKHNVTKSKTELIDQFIKNAPRITRSRSDFYNPADVAMNSQIDKEDIISETLAIVYSNQGNLEKAIKIYEKLILKVPEKSSYFARQLEKIKKKQNLNN